MESSSALCLEGPNSYMEVYKDKVALDFFSFCHKALVNVAGKRYG